MQAVQVPGPEDAVARSSRARYTAGRFADTTGGEFVSDFAAEPMVDRDRQTETFAEVILHVTTPRWAGTRFVLRAGKALAVRAAGAL